MMTVLMTGDVMIGRGLDQILPHPNAPTLHEPSVRDAREYVALAEAVHGTIPRSVDGAYVWGDALQAMDRAAPHARIINLETSVTQSDDYWKTKDIHYRLHPENAGCLTAARLDACVLANNHVLDYGPRGLVETLDTLSARGIRSAGAGRTRAEAEAPVRLPLTDQVHLLLVALGSETSGIPSTWASSETSPGVDWLGDLSQETAAAISARIARTRRAGDIVMVSIHWGTNWGYEVPDDEVAFAHTLIDEGVDIVHGHSSHHVRPIERYRDRLILYGCGDLLNDYEGISGYEAYRDDLGLLYFPTVSATGALLALRMVPMQIARFRLQRAMTAESQWLCDTLNQISAPFGSDVELQTDGSLTLRG